MQPSSIVFLSVSPEIWIGLAAILTSPLVALLIEKYLEKLRAQEDRRVMIFRALMANRASRLSPAYVQALNGVEVEFFGETRVIEAWRSLLDQLNTPHDKVTDPQVTQWNDRVTTFLNDLLYEMGESLGYHFDKVSLKKNAYYPSGWQLVEGEQMKLRQAAVKVFEGEKPLKVEITGQNQP